MVCKCANTFLDIALLIFILNIHIHMIISKFVVNNIHTRILFVSPRSALPRPNLC